MSLYKRGRRGDPLLDCFAGWCMQLPCVRPLPGTTAGGTRQQQRRDKERNKAAGGPPSSFETVRWAMHATVWCLWAGGVWFSVHPNSRYSIESSAAQCNPAVSWCAHDTAISWISRVAPPASGTGVPKRRSEGREGRASDKAAALLRDYPQAQGVGAPRNEPVPRGTEGGASAASHMPHAQPAKRLSLVM